MSKLETGSFSTEVLKDIEIDEAERRKKVVTGTGAIAIAGPWPETANHSCTWPIVAGNHLVEERWPELATTS